VDNIKIHLTERCETVDWIHMSQNRVQRWVLALLMLDFDIHYYEVRFPFV